MNDKYSPNRVPFATRMLNVIYASVLIALGSYFLFTGDLLLPGRRTSGPNGLELHGITAWVMVAAMLCGTLVLLSEIVDHYDRRNNEARYRRFGLSLKYTGWALFLLAFLVYAIDGAT